MKNKEDVIIGGIVLVCVCAYLMWLISDCDGTLVRGLFWFECVGVVK